MWDLIRGLLYKNADKDRELGDALAEIKSLRNSERLKEKAVEEVLQFDTTSTCLFVMSYIIVSFLIHRFPNVYLSLLVLLNTLM